MTALLISGAALLLALALTALAWKQRAHPGNKPLGWITLIIALWFLAQTLQFLLPAFRNTPLWNAVPALFSALWAVFFYYALVFTGRACKLDRRLLALLIVEPLVVLAASFQEPSSTWFSLQPHPPSQGSAGGRSLIANLDMAYCLVLCLVSYFLVLDHLQHAVRIYHKQAVVLLIAIGFPGMILAADFFNAFPPHTDGLEVVGLVFLLFTLGVGVFRYRILGLALAERSEVLDLMPYGLIVVDTEGRIVDMNATAEQIMSITASDVLGGVTLPGLNYQAYLRPEPAYVEVSIYKDDQRRDFVLRTTPVRNGTPTHLGWMLVLVDVKDSRRLVNSLRESEQRYQLLAENANDGIIMIQDYRIIYVNPQAAAMFGYSEEELLEQRFDKFLPSEILQTILERHQQRLDGENLEDRYEFTYQHRSGRSVTIESNACIFELDGKPAVLGILRDVTERKHHEDELRRSQKQLAAILDAVSDGITVLDNEARVIFANESVARVFGYETLEAYLNSSPADRFSRVEIFTDDGQLLSLEEMPASRVYLGKDAQPMILKIHNRMRNSDEWFSISTKPVRNEAGEVQFIVLATHNLTPQKLSEKSLRETGQFLNAIITSAQEGIVVYDLELRYIVWNPFMEQLTSLKAQEVLGKPALELFPHLRRKGIDTLLFNALRGEPSVSHDVFIEIPQTGKTAWIAGSYSPYFDGQGNIVGVVGILVDITSRRFTEDQLHKLSLSVEQSPAIIFITDKNGIFEYVNPKFCQVTGYDSAEVIGRSTRILKSGETAGAMYAGMWQTISRGEVWRGEFHNRRKDGSLYWVFATVSPVMDSERNITHFLAIQEDVTERKRMEETEHRRLQELESLRATMADISGELDVSRLLKKIMERVLALLHADRGMLSLYRAETNDLEIVVSVSQHRDFTGRRVKLGEGGVGRCAQMRKPLIVEKYSEWDDRIPDFVVDWPYSVINVPLIIGQDLLGVITAGADSEEHSFSIEDRQLMEMFALEAALAVRNARLLDETRRLAITDGLTGLYNRRHFMNLASAEHDRSRRYPQSLSMIMFDIDHFKRVNDRFGHSVGDQVLQALARQVKEQVRAVDVIARYGGEEFVVMMPETALNQALQMGERLRSAVESMKIPTEKGGVKVTISVGVACLDDNGEDVGALLDRADQAMYRAKQAGRNKVSV